MLAWIISRDSKMVEHMASDGQSALKKWKAVDWCIEAQQAESRGAKKVSATFEAALAAMAYAAETGLVTACGCIRYDKGPGRRQSISSHFWTNGITLDDSILKTHPNSMHAGLRTVDWLGVWFDRPSVLQIWEDSIQHVEPIARTESKKSPEEITLKEPGPKAPKARAAYEALIQKFGSPNVPLTLEVHEAKRIVDAYVTKNPAGKFKFQKVSADVVARVLGRRKNDPRRD